MRSKILKLIAVLAMCFMVVGALVACGGEQGAAGAQGEKGEAGKGIVSIDLSADGTKLVIKYTDGNTAEVTIPSVSRACDVCENVTIHEFFGEEHGAAYDAESDTWTFTKGKYLKVCEDCGMSEIVMDVIHDYEEDTFAPTCTEIGFTGKRCECGHYEAVAGSEKDPLGHEFAPGKIVIHEERNKCEYGYWTLGACTREGCMASEPVFVAPVGHKVVTWTKGNTPTVGGTGTLTGVCSVCNETQTIVLPKLALGETAYDIVTDDTVACEAVVPATFTYTVAATDYAEEQKFEYTVTLPAIGHVVGGVAEDDLVRVQGAVVYGQKGVSILDEIEAPKCGEIVDGFYTCDKCGGHITTEVYGDHTWDEGVTVEATCQAPTTTTYKCTEKVGDVLCTGVKVVKADDQLDHVEEYGLGYAKVGNTLTFSFGIKCSECDEIIAGNTDVTDSVVFIESTATCIEAGVDKYYYVYNQAGDKVYCDVPAPATGNHTLVVDGVTVQPDARGYYSANYIGKGLFVLTLPGQSAPDQVTCGNTYPGFFNCVCGEVKVSVTIYNPHNLVFDEDNADNKAPTCIDVGQKVYVCDKACCTGANAYSEIVFIAKIAHEFEYELVQELDGSYSIYGTCKTVGCGETDNYFDLTEDDYTVETVPSTCIKAGKEIITVTKDLGTADEIVLENVLPLAAHKLSADMLITEWDSKVIGGKSYYEYNKNIFEVLNLPTIDCGTASTFQGFFVCAHCEGNILVDLYADHTYGEWTVTTAPECNVAGEQSATCEKCGHVDTKPVLATGHSDLRAEVERPATANDMGEIKVICGVCNGEVGTYEVLPTTDNAAYSKVVVNADCFNQGSITYTITVEVAALEAEFTVSFKEITGETEHGIAVGGEYYYFTVDDEIDGVVYKIEYKVYLCANCGNFVVADWWFVPVEITPATPVEP